MNIRPKFLRLLALCFRSSAKVNCVALGVSTLAVLVGNLAAAQSASDALPGSVAECEAKFAANFTVIKNFSDEKINPSKIDEAYLNRYCDSSIDSLLNQKDGDSGTQKFGPDGHALDRWNGACQLSYLQIRAHYEQIQKGYHSYCEKVQAITKLAADCKNKNSTSTLQSCTEDLGEKVKDAEANFTELKTKILDEIPEHINKRRDTNKHLAETFDIDRKNLAPAVAPTDLLQYPGGIGFQNLEEYKQHLLAAMPNTKRLKYNNQLSNGPLIDEQMLAHSNVDKFVKTVGDFATKSLVSNSTLSAYTEEFKKREEKKGSGNREMIGGAAAAAPALAALGNQAKGAGSAISSASTAGISGVAASAALPLASLGLAAANNRSGSSTSAGALPNLPTAAPAPAPVEAIKATTFGGGDRVAASAGKAVNDALDASEKKTETPALTASANPFSADGSSRMGEIKHSAKPNSGSNEERKTENHANTSDVPGIVPLGGGARSTPKASAGADVTSLLGQMKSLFNFDDAGAGAGGGGGGHEGVFGGSVAGLPVGGMPMEGPAAGFLEGGSAALETQSHNGEVTHDDSPVQAENLALESESLFERVHKRHLRSMKRGLVVLNLSRYKQ